MFFQSSCTIAAEKGLAVSTDACWLVATEDFLLVEYNGFVRESDLLHLGMGASETSRKMAPKSPRFSQFR